MELLGVGTLFILLRTLRKIPLIFAVVLYGCESWFVTFREEHWLRFFESRVLRRTFGQKRVKLTGDKR
jgi:hypothetical protein